MDQTAGAPVRVLYVSPAAGDPPLADRQDFEVSAVPDADAAIARLDGECIDCVVCDHDPPAVDAPATVAAITESRPRLPVVVSPTDGDEAVASESLAAGAMDYVPRDGGFDLAARVRRTATESRPVGSVAPDGGAENISEAIKERAMDEAPVGITITDPSQRDNPVVYCNDSFEDLTGYPAGEVVGRNCRFLQGADTDPAPVDEIREAVRTDTPVTTELLNYRRDGTPFWNRITISPIRDDAGEVVHYVGFQTDVTERVEAERETERERRRLEQVLDRVNGLIQDVTKLLVEAGSRTDIEEAVCERLTAPDAWDAAWVGRPDPVDDAVAPTAWAGLDDALCEDVALAPDDDDPVARAVAEDALQVSTDVPALTGGGEGDVDRFGSVAAVPLSYRDTRYGVLAVYAEAADAFDEREQVVLNSVGRAVASGVNSVESKRIIAADSVVDLELAVSDRELFFVDLAAALDCRLAHEGSVARADGSSLLFFTVEGATGDEVRRFAGGRADVTRTEVIVEDDDACVVEFELPEESLVRDLADYGAQVRSMTADSGTGRLRVELPTGADVRSLVDTLQDRHPGTELVAYRERERPAQTKQEFVAELRDRLTDRQLTALRTAAVGGFFEWPRSVDGEDLAESMDISRSTFHQHLRAAQRKLVDAIFD